MKILSSDMARRVQLQYDFSTAENREYSNNLFVALAEKRIGFDASISIRGKVQLIVDDTHYYAYLMTIDEQADALQHAQRADMSLPPKSELAQTASQ
tara:strand:+ start:126 stop:416 length:291 start_codon:yes stop_codon:yes gene_type:complete